MSGRVDAKAAVRLGETQVERIEADEEEGSEVQDEREEQREERKEAGAEGRSQGRCRQEVRRRSQGEEERRMDGGLGT